MVERAKYTEVGPDPEIRKAKRHDTLANRLISFLFYGIDNQRFPRTTEELRELYIRAKIHDVEIDSEKKLSPSDTEKLKLQIEQGITTGSLEDYESFINDSELQQRMQNSRSGEATVPVSGFLSRLVDRVKGR